VRLCLWTAATNSHTVHPPGDSWVWSHGGVKLVKENLRAWSKTYPRASLSTINPTWTDIGTNQVLCGERPVTYHLNHGTAKCNIKLNHKIGQSHLLLWRYDTWYLQIKVDFLSGTMCWHFSRDTKQNHVWMNDGWLFSVVLHISDDVQVIPESWTLNLTFWNSSITSLESL
jgi:hypothetical protein